MGGAMATRARITAEEYLALPEMPAGRRQLVDGEVVMNEPTWRHQRIVGDLHAELRAWTRAAPGRGRASLPVDVRMDGRNVFAPDVLWLSEARRPRSDVVFLDAVPDLAVEVRSPSTWRYDVGAKKAAYERAGLRELWLVDHPVFTVLVFRRSAPGAPGFDISLEVSSGEALSSPLLPSFGLDLAELLAPESA